MLEEVGEISGWYKKHLGYGRPKEGKILTGLKEEFGDLMYYLVKLGEITDMLDILEPRFEDTYELPTADNINYVACMAEMAHFANDLMLSSEHSVDFVEAYANMFDHLTLLMSVEGFDMEDIQFSNLAKLNVRHGEGFKDEQAIPQDRDKDAENEALNG